jgi:tryptophan synthase alpha chain
LSSRIKEIFSRVKTENRKALINYIVSGDPNLETTLDIMNAMVEEGVDIIELGVPFSDPMAEGVSIQKGHERALENGTSLRDTFKLVEKFRETNVETAIVFMGYMNTFESLGAQEFMIEADKVGLDGILIVDMPPEESSDFTKYAEERSIDIIRLIAPTTSSARSKIICSQASGYIYYISVKGITGAGNLDAEDVKINVKELRQHTNLPIAIGFGIKDSASASSVKEVADGIVVGSVFVDLIGEGGDILKKVKGKTKELSEALS